MLFDSAKFAVLGLGLGMASVNAQNVTESTTSTASAAAASSTVVAVSSSMIPSNITSSCTTFLSGLNTDSEFTSCISPLVNLTSVYNPVSSNTSDATTTSAITSTLTQLCSSSSGCSDDLIRSYLTKFYTACKSELTNSTSYSSQVREMYDFLYVVNPFKGAVCAKNGASAKYCVLEIADNAAANISTTSAANTTSNFKSLAAITAQDVFSPAVALAAANLVIVKTTTTASALTRRFLNVLGARATTDDDSTAIITPNTTTYLSTGIAYLFLQPNMTSSVLCTSCAKSVLASYVSWESEVPYALGLDASPILGKQSELWASVESTCGSTFAESIQTQAGVLSTNGTSSTSAAEGHLAVGKVGAVMAGVVGVLGFLTI